MTDAGLKEMKRIGKLLSSRRRETIPLCGMKAAAVMMLIFEEAGELKILFTKRTDKVSTHQGQISFPGGVAHQEDKGPVDTALRETMEEVGVAAGRIKVLGGLDDITTISNFVISPFAGYMEERPEYCLSEREIDRVIEVPIKALLEKQYFKAEEWIVDKGEVHMVYYFDYKDDVIWGATARILHQFLTLCYGF